MLLIAITATATHWPRWTAFATCGGPSRSPTRRRSGHRPPSRASRPFDAHHAAPRRPRYRAGHRLVAVHRLAAIGLNFDQIAAELGITTLNARPLQRTALWVALEAWWDRRWARDLKQSKPGSRLPGVS
jgi:hypothetical protein